jgi:multidrug efflux pump subunit AcrB
MNVSESAVKYTPLVLFTLVLLVISGLYSYNRLGKLEDPEFTIKIATIVTLYPGASAVEVEQQVTDEIEKAVQRLEGIDKIRSVSKAGVSIVYLYLLESYRPAQIPQKWDILRRKVIEAERELPPGAHRPMVFDDYGDVFGVFLALTGDGYSYAEMKTYAQFLQRELLLVENVNRVEIWGTRTECIYVEIARARLAEMGIHPRQIIDTLQKQNLIVESGRVDAGTERIRLEPSGTFQSIGEIEELVISGTQQQELVLMKDVASITRAYVDPPHTMMRFNGKPAIGIAISTISRGNVVDMGRAVQKRLDELMLQLPAGIEGGVVSYQAEDVLNAINSFVINLLLALTIVTGILLVTMGIRSGLLISSALIFTVLGTFVVMLPLGIDLQRASLGAFIIALGMLVDNAIVVTEGSLVSLQRGDSRLAAMTRPATTTAWPLLGATIIAIAGFLPIALARNNTGEYCLSMFQVVAISLALSWIIAMTVTPVLGSLFLRVPARRQGTDPYAGPVYRNYRYVLQKALAYRKATILLMMLLLALGVLGFGYVPQIFFPDSDKKMFMIQYWLPEGTSIYAVSEDVRAIEDHLLASYPEIVSVASCLGAGAPRFNLSYEPETPNTSFGEIFVNVTELRHIDTLIPAIERYLAGNFPQAEPRLRRFPLGPFTPFKIEARISGPDPVVLRELSRQVQEIMLSDPQSKDTRDNWRHKTKVYSPDFSQPRARRAHVSRQDMAVSLSIFSDGFPVGTYREADELLPILVRAPEVERQDIDNLENLPVWGASFRSVPLKQIVAGIDTTWEDPIIHRYNRRRTITAGCDPVDGITSDEVHRRIQPAVEALTLPRGYYLEWGGEFEENEKSSDAVYSQLPIAFLIMAFVIVALFNSFRQPVIIVLVLPLALVGVTAGLLITGKPFGFMALLGVLSLFGMLIKNAVVLLHQIDLNIREGAHPYLAVMDSSVSRMRPVLMATFTTVLGMIPLLTDPLYVSMAVAIMFGLTFATVLTLIIVPVLYTLFFKIAPEPTRQTQSAQR